MGEQQHLLRETRSKNRPSTLDEEEWSDEEHGSSCSSYYSEEDSDSCSKSTLLHEKFVGEMENNVSESNIFEEISTSFPVDLTLRMNVILNTNNFGKKVKEKTIVSFTEKQLTEPSRDLVTPFNCTDYTAKMPKHSEQSPTNEFLCEVKDEAISNLPYLPGIGGNNVIDRQTKEKPDHESVEIQNVDYLQEAYFQHQKNCLRPMKFKPAKYKIIKSTNDDANKENLIPILKLENFNSEVEPILPKRITKRCLADISNTSGSENMKARKNRLLHSDMKVISKENLMFIEKIANTSVNGEFSKLMDDKQLSYIETTEQIVNGLTDSDESRRIPQSYLAVVVPEINPNLGKELNEKNVKYENKENLTEVRPNHESANENLVYASQTTVCKSNTHKSQTRQGKNKRKNLVEFSKSLYSAKQNNFLINKEHCIKDLMLDTTSNQFSQGFNKIIQLNSSGTVVPQKHQSSSLLVSSNKPIGTFVNENLNIKGTTDYEVLDIFEEYTYLHSKRIITDTLISNETDSTYNAKIQNKTVISSNITSNRALYYNEHQTVEGARFENVSMKVESINDKVVKTFPEESSVHMKADVSIIKKPSEDRIKTTSTNKPEITCTISLNKIPKNNGCSKATSNNINNVETTLSLISNKKVEVNKNEMSIKKGSNGQYTKNTNKSHQHLTRNKQKSGRKRRKVSAPEGLKRDLKRNKRKNLVEFSKSLYSAKQNNFLINKEHCIKDLMLDTTSNQFSQGFNNIIPLNSSGTVVPQKQDVHATDIMQHQSSSLLVSSNKPIGTFVNENLKMKGSTDYEVLDIFGEYTYLHSKRIITDTLISNQTDSTYNAKIQNKTVISSNITSNTALYHNEHQTVEGARFENMSMKVESINDKVVKTFPEESSVHIKADVSLIKKPSEDRIKTTSTNKPDITCTISLNKIPKNNGCSKATSSYINNVETTLSLISIKKVEVNKNEMSIEKVSNGQYTKNTDKSHQHLTRNKQISGRKRRTQNAPEGLNRDLKRPLLDETGVKSNNPIPQPVDSQLRDSYVNLPTQILESAPYWLKSEETRYWNKRPHNPTSSYRLRDVPLHSEEADRIMHQIDRQSGYYSYLRYNRISRIENPYLMSAYLLEKQKAVKEFGHDMVKSELLLHGTKKSRIHEIATHNLQLDYVVRHRYGKGIYFTNDIVFASKFCNFSNPKEMIVANVLLSHCCRGDETMDYPLIGCDYTMNRTDNGQDVFVKYEENTFCPAYIVNFEIIY